MSPFLWSQNGSIFGGVKMARFLVESKWLDFWCSQNGSIFGGVKMARFLVESKLLYFFCQNDSILGGVIHFFGVKMTPFFWSLDISSGINYN